MNHIDDQAGPENILPALFGLLTARFEDGATLAAKGQAPGASESVPDLTVAIASILDEAIVLNRTIETIQKLSAPGSGRSPVE